MMNEKDGDNELMRIRLILMIMKKIMRDGDEDCKDNEWEWYW